MVDNSSMSEEADMGRYMLDSVIVYSSNILPLNFVLVSQISFSLS